MDGPDCPACGYSESAHLGTMGSTEWFRCRACGMDHCLNLTPTEPVWAPIKTVTLQPGEAELLFSDLPVCDDPDCSDCGDGTVCDGYDDDPDL